MARPPRSADARRRALRAGHGAELIAAAWLTMKGYRVLAHRYAAHGGEIDLVARRGGTVIFVEVKARATFDAALDAISFTKAEKFTRAVDAWLMRNPWANVHVLRADAILISPWRRPRHLENAFALER